MNDRIVAGNWKMNMDRTESAKLLDDIVERKDDIPNGVDLIVAPAAPFLDLAVQKTLGTDILISGQNCYFEESGAFTGEISTQMLSSLGTNACIIGHSERRQVFGETDDMVSKKVDALLTAGLLPIFCCGEDQSIRESGGQFEFVQGQIENALFNLEPERFSSLVIAYEPIWAIGTGLTASPEQAQDMHAHIRARIKEKYGEEMARHTRILYGGSCKPDNAKELFACPDVDGGLIGGAALNAEHFIQIAQAAANS